MRSPGNVGPRGWSWLEGLIEVEILLGRRSGGFEGRGLVWKTEVSEDLSNDRFVCDGSDDA